MGQIVYFLDWRPVAFLPVAKRPACAPIRPLEPDKSRITPFWREVIERVRYRWRDDGIVIFEITVKGAFEKIVDARYATPAVDRKAYDEASQEARAIIDRIIRRGVAAPDRPVLRAILERAGLGGLLEPRQPPSLSKDKLWAAIFEHARDEASREIKERLQQTQPFPPPENAEDADEAPDIVSEEMRTAYLKIAPIQISGDPQSLFQTPASRTNDEWLRAAVASVEARGEGRDKTVLSFLAHDRALVRLVHVRTDARRPRRPALFELRRAYARVFDKIIAFRPQLGDRFIFRRIWRVPWPFSLAPLAFIAWAFLFVMAALAVGLFPVLGPSLFTQLALIDSLLAVLVAVAAVYPVIEFRVRRARVIGAFESAAGILEFGATLGAVTALIAANAKETRLKNQISADQGAAVRIVQRIIEQERELRDGHREAFMVVITVVAALFGGLAIVNAAYNSPLNSTGDNTLRTTQLAHAQGLQPTAQTPRIDRSTAGP